MAGRGVEGKEEEELSEPWLAKGRREFLIDRIKKQKAEGLIPEDTKINDKLLAKEHLRFWLTIGIEDKLFRLLSHPLLTKKDQ